MSQIFSPYSVNNLASRDFRITAIKPQSKQLFSETVLIWDIMSQKILWQIAKPMWQCKMKHLEKSLDFSFFLKMKPVFCTKLLLKGKTFIFSLINYLTIIICEPQDSPRLFHFPHLKHKENAQKYLSVYSNGHPIIYRPNAGTQNFWPLRWSGIGN